MCCCEFGIWRWRWTKIEFSRTKIWASEPSGATERGKCESWCDEFPFLFLFLVATLFQLNLVFFLLLALSARQVKCADSLWFRFLDARHGTVWLPKRSGFHCICCWRCWEEWDAFNAVQVLLHFAEFCTFFFIFLLSTGHTCNAMLISNYDDDDDCWHCRPLQPNDSHAYAIQIIWTERVRSVCAFNFGLILCVRVENYFQIARRTDYLPFTSTLCG